MLKLRYVKRGKEEMKRISKSFPCVQGVNTRSMSEWMSIYYVAAIVINRNGAIKKNKFCKYRVKS